MDSSTDPTYRYTQSYYAPDYSTSGYDSYLTKSIDTQARAVVDPVNLSSPNQYADNSMNFDQSEVSGSLGNVLQIGAILLDGTNGKISIFDDTGNEAIILGNLDS